MPDTHAHPHSYQLQHATAQELGLDSLPTGQVPPLRLTIHGECFLIRARDPRIMIGDLKVVDFEIASDMRKIVCYVHQTPVEGALISVDYGPNDKVILDEPFTLDKLNADGDS